MFSTPKIIAVAALLLAPLDALAGTIYRRMDEVRVVKRNNDDPQSSFSECHISQRVPAIVFISVSDQPLIPGSFNLPASSLARRAAVIRARPPR